MAAAKDAFSGATAPKDVVSAAEKGKRESGLKVCSPTVCIGGAHPAHCVCPTPTTQKK